MPKKYEQFNMKKLTKIIDSIEQNMIDNGFNSLQVQSFTKQQGHLTIFECIREVLNNRGEGLFEYFYELYEEKIVTGKAQ